MCCTIMFIHSSSDHRQTTSFIVRTLTNNFSHRQNIDKQVFCLSSLGRSTFRIWISLKFQPTEVQKSIRGGLVFLAIVLNRLMGTSCIRITFSIYSLLVVKRRSGTQDFPRNKLKQCPRSSIEYSSFENYLMSFADHRLECDLLVESKKRSRKTKIKDNILKKILLVS